MRLHSYRDESHSRHFDLIGGGGHPWSIDLVYVTASAILVVGFGCALAVNWIYKSFARCLAEVWEPLAALLLAGCCCSCVSPSVPSVAASYQCDLIRQRYGFRDGNYWFTRSAAVAVAMYLE